MLNKKFYFAFSSLIGAIVGVGIFGIPYVVWRAGFLVGSVYLIFFGGVVLLLHLVYGEIVCRTKEKHRLPGYTAKYLGKRASYLAIFSITFGLFSALLAYIIVGSDFLAILLPSPFSGQTMAGVLFWALLSFGVWRGIKTVAWIEFLMTIFLLVMMGVIFAWGAGKIDFANLTSFNPSHILLPYGVILFALSGMGAVPEIKEIFTKGDGHFFPKAIIWGSLIPAVLYFLFALVVVGVSGRETSQEAIKGLSQFLGKGIVSLGALFGLLAVSTSFLLWGLHLKNTFIYDFKIQKDLATCLVVGLPLFLFLLGLRSFISIIGIAGVVMGAIEGTLILLMFKKAKKIGNRQPEYSLKIPSLFLYFLIFIFLVGAISQTLYFILR